MSDDAGMALLAYIDAIHLDDALAWVETGDGCHCAWRETDKQREGRGIKGNDCWGKLNQDKTNTSTS